MLTISLINGSTVLSNAEVQAALPALQSQISRDFAPNWGIDAELKFWPSTQTAPPAGSWWLVILDDADQALALGYHDVTPDGLPLGKVFARTDRDSGHVWTVTASHELLEMLADPWMDRATVVLDGANCQIYAYEVCDACEDDGFGYRIGGTQVSDFVFPAWFNPKSQAAKFDHCGHITRPLGLLAGGYIGVFDSGSGWKQQDAPNTAKQFDDKLKVPRRLAVNFGSRRERRARNASGGPIVRSTPFPRPGDSRRDQVARVSVIAALTVLNGADH